MITRTKEQEDILNNIADFILLHLKVDVRKNTNRRSRNLVECRTLFFILAQKSCFISYELLGNYLNKDHSTVVHSFKIWDNYLSEQFKELYEKYFNVKPKQTDNTVNYLLAEIEELKEKIELTNINEFKELFLKDSDIIKEFTETRLKPFLNMVNNRVTNKDLIQIQKETRIM